MTLHPDDPIAARLDDWAREYDGRRTVAGRMLNDARTLVDAAARHHHHLAETRIYQQQQTHEAEVARLERQATQLRDQLAAARKVQTEAQALVAEKTRLQEEREQHDEEVRIQIGRRLGGWQVGDLEECCYRLRTGGATDTTPVEVHDYWIRAKVPAPNLVPLTRPSDETRAERLAESRPAPAPAPTPVPSRGTRVRAALGSPAGLLAVAFFGWGAIASVLEAATRW